MNETTGDLRFHMETLSLDRIQSDRERSRPEARGRLLDSIAQTGLHVPLTVCRLDGRTFRIVDGRRRYLCCAQIELSPIPCVVYGELTDGQYESLRLIINTTHKDWTPFERAESVGRMRRACGARTADELAGFANASTASIANALLLLDAGVQRRAAVSEYGLSQTYCDEFIRLRADFRKVKDIQPTEMDDIVLRKVQNNAIRRAKDLRRLKDLFKRHPAHEESLHRFLTDPDMTVDELCARAESSNLAVDLERAARSITGKLGSGSGCSERGRTAVRRLKTLCEEVLRRETSGP